MQHVFEPVKICSFLKEEMHQVHLYLFFLVKGEGGSRTTGIAGENRVAAVVRDSSLSVPTHSAEELLQTALCFYCCGETTGIGDGSGGSTAQLQGLLLCVAGDG